jgi:hypothetical protein
MLTLKPILLTIVVAGALAGCGSSGGSGSSSANFAQQGNALCLSADQAVKNTPQPQNGNLQSAITAFDSLASTLTNLENGIKKLTPPSSAQAAVSSGLTLLQNSIDDLHKASSAAQNKDATGVQSAASAFQTDLNNGLLKLGQGGLSTCSVGATSSPTDNTGSTSNPTDNSGSSSPTDNTGSTSNPTDNSGSSSPTDNSGSSSPTDNSGSSSTTASLQS